MQAPRFYYFDVGVVNYLLGRTNLKRGTDEFGHAFEHLVIQEIVAYLGYTESTEKLFYWITYTGIEVDAIIGDARIAIEIKSTDEVQTKHKKNLKVFAEEHPNARKIIVSLDKMTREANGIEMIYVLVAAECHVALDEFLAGTAVVGVVEDVGGIAAGGLLVGFPYKEFVLHNLCVSCDR